MPEVERPFSTFNFELMLKRDGHTLCEGSFSECDGLELSFEVKTIREGGNNARQIHLPGPVSYGQLSFKRGMTSSYDLWDWFEVARAERSERVDGEVRIFSSDRSRTVAHFRLTRCLPVKLKAPSLNAKDGGIAVEEMQVAYETLTRIRPESEAI